MVSDASERVAFVYEANNWRIVEEFAFDERERGLSSGHRELKAIVKTIERHAGRLAKGAGVSLITPPDKTPPEKTPPDKTPPKKAPPDKKPPKKTPQL